MLKCFLVFFGFIFFPISVMAYGHMAGTCDIDQDFSSIYAMQDRVRNQNHGSYSVTSNMDTYISGQPVELTISGPDFTGIVFAVVDGNGNRVGTFDTNSGVVTDCLSTFAISHTASFGSVSSYRLFWIPPISNVGEVYVLGYVLSGSRGNSSSQQFYRFVRDDNSAISLNSEIIFGNSFE